MSFPRAVGFAVEGLKEAYTNHPNVRRQLAAAAGAVILGAVFRLSPVEWAILVLAACLVLFAELVNTAIEEVVNLATRELRKEAKAAKDIAAGMVLLTAGVSLVIALLLFVPKLTGLFYK